MIDVPRRIALWMAGVGALLGLTHGRARAANGDQMILGQLNASTATTALTGLVSGPAVDLTNTRDFGGGRGLLVTGSSNPSGDGIVASGGSSVGAGTAGLGTRAVGGSAALPGGAGVRAVGGDTVSATGGAGALSYGRDSDAAQCGAGAVAEGRPGLVGQGGAGAHASGGNTSSQSAGAGTIAVGGDAPVHNGQPGPGAIGRGGDTANPAGPAGIGVVGHGGIFGLTNSANQPGVRGDNSSGPAIVGENPGAAGGPAVSGIGATSGGDFQAGGTPAINGDGVIGTSVTGTGAQGFSSAQAGAQGDSPGAPAVRGQSKSQVGVAGFSSQGTGGVFVSQTKDQAGVLADYAIAGQPTAPTVLVNGDWKVVNGIKSAAVPTQRGLRLLYAVEGPVPMLEDMGVVRLQGGRQRVQLDEVFLQTIEPDDYYVFLAPRGASPGVYVGTQGNGWFEIVEAAGGTGVIEVSYRVVARRRGYRTDRFPAFTRPAPARPPTRGRPERPDELLPAIPVPTRARFTAPADPTVPTRNQRTNR